MQSLQNSYLTQNSANNKKELNQSIKSRIIEISCKFAQHFILEECTNCTVVSNGEELDCNAVFVLHGAVVTGAWARTLCNDSVISNYLKLHNLEFRYDVNNNSVESIIYLITKEV